MTTPARRPNVVEIAIDIVNRMNEREKLIDEACRLLPDMRGEIEKQSTEYLRLLVDMLNDEPSPF